MEEAAAAAGARGGGGGGGGGGRGQGGGGRRRGVEVAAYLQGWHLEEVASLLAVDGLFAASYAGWMRLRLDYLAPPLQFLTNACVALFMVQSIDRLVLCLGCFWIRFKGIKPVPQAAAAGKPDVEAGAGDY